jgi:hypothetical protein
MTQYDHEPGSTYINADVRDPRDAALRMVSGKALGDKGVMTRCIPEHIVARIKLQELEKRGRYMARQPKSSP